MFTISRLEIQLITKSKVFVKHSTLIHKYYFKLENPEIYIIFQWSK